jgi:hypothetical protein
VPGHRGLGQARQGGNQLARGRSPPVRATSIAPAGFGNRLEDVHATSIPLHLYRCKPMYALGGAAPAASARTLR